MRIRRTGTLLWWSGCMRSMSEDRWNLQVTLRRKQPFMLLLLGGAV